MLSASGPSWSLAFGTSEGLCSGHKCALHALLSPHRGNVVSSACFTVLVQRKEINGCLEFLAFRRSPAGVWLPSQPAGLLPADGTGPRLRAPQQR